MSMTTGAQSQKLNASIAFAGLLGANLAVNLSAFVILMAASYIMSIGDFAELSKLMAIVVVGSAFLDGGLNITVIKRYSTDGGSGAEAMLAAKAWIVVAAIIFLLLSAFDVTSIFWGIGIFAAAMQNLWGGLRARDQAAMDYKSIGRMSALLSLLRICFAAPALASGSWIAVAIALWIAPNLILALSKKSLFSTMFQRSSFSTLANMAGYSLIVYISALSFGILPYLPQTFITLRLSANEVATFGLVLVGLGPIGLFFASARAYALPRLMQGGTPPQIRIETAIAGGLLLFLGLVASYYVLDFLYGIKFPNFAKIYLICASFYSMTLLVGLYNIKAHAIHAPQLELAANVVRLACALLALIAFGSSLEAIAWIFGSVLLAGEVALAFVIWKVSR